MKSIDKKNLQVTYSSESNLKTFKKYYKNVFRQKSKAIYLGWQFATRDLKARYRQTLLGFMWLLLPVLITTLIFMFLSKSGLLNTGEIKIPYPVYAFLGSLFWQLFNDSLLNPIMAVNSAKTMLSKIQFPRESLILSSFFQIIFQFVIKLIVVIPLLVYYKIDISWEIVLLPFAIFSIVLMGLTIGLFLIPLNLIYQDVQQSLQVILGLLIFLTPVGYKPPNGSMLEKLVNLNPLTPLLNTARNWTTIGGFAHLYEVIAITAVFSVLFIIGMVLYLVLMPIVIERQSA